MEDAKRVQEQLGLSAEDTNRLLASPLWNCILDLLAFHNRVVESGKEDVIIAIKTLVSNVIAPSATQEVNPAGLEEAGKI